MRLWATTVWGRCVRKGWPGNTLEGLKGTAGRTHGLLAAQPLGSRGRGTSSPRGAAPREVKNNVGCRVAAGVRSPVPPWLRTGFVMARPPGTCRKRSTFATPWRVRMTSASMSPFGLALSLPSLLSPACPLSPRRPFRGHLHPLSPSLLADRRREPASELEAASPHPARRSWRLRPARRRYWILVAGRPARCRASEARSGRQGGPSYSSPPWPIPRETGSSCPRALVSSCGREIVSDPHVHIENDPEHRPSVFHPGLFRIQCSAREFRSVCRPQRPPPRPTCPVPSMAPRPRRAHFPAIPPDHGIGHLRDYPKQGSERPKPIRAGWPRRHWRNPISLNLPSDIRAGPILDPVGANALCGLRVLSVGTLGAAILLLPAMRVTELSFVDMLVAPIRVEGYRPGNGRRLSSGQFHAAEPPGVAAADPWSGRGYRVAHGEVGPEPLGPADQSLR